MQLHQALKLLALLPADPTRASSVAELVDRWAEWGDMHEDSKRHTMRRWVNELSEHWPSGGPSPVRRVDGAPGQPARYHRDRVALATLFMPVELGMMLVTAGGIFDRALGEQAGFDVANLEPAARSAIEGRGREAANLLRTIRIMPDGIDRKDARVDPKVLASTIKALAQERRLSFKYRAPNAGWSPRIVHPLGLVAKDGTRYLIAQADSGIRQYAMHRMRDADVQLEALMRPWGFDLDAHVHEFLHGGAPVRLVLRVHREALWHFEERPLIADQWIDATDDADWYRVSANLRETVQLVPFLLSMGWWIEVLEPRSVRDKVADRATRIAAHYAVQP